MMSLKRLKCFFWLAFIIWIHASTAFAQIVADGSLGGPAGALTGPNFDINADLGRIEGSNLFHSFSEFNLANGESATFSGPTSIANILSRVTGNNPSNIDGLMRSTIDGANLYFLNPNGVFFGANAQIDVSGSFVISTADYLKLQDGGVFNGSLDATDVLTTAPPSAFGFSKADAAPIRIVGNEIIVAEKQSFAAVGGDITIDGAEIKVPGGHAHLTSVASIGEVLLDVTDSEAVSGVNGFNELGDIAMEGSGGFDENDDYKFKSDTVVDVSGTPGGRVVVRGGNLQMESSGIFANSLGTTDAAGLGVNISVLEEISLVNAAILSNTTIAEDAGSIKIFNSDSLSLDYSQISNNTEDSSTGDAGDILLSGIREISLTNESEITSQAYDSNGNAGSVYITDVDSIQLEEGSYIFSTAYYSDGDGSIISISNVGSIQLSGESEISSQAYYGNGNAGDVYITEVKSISLSDESEISSEILDNSGNAGLVEIKNVGNISLQDYSKISSNAFDSEGDSGSVSITDIGSIYLQNESFIASEVVRSNGNAGLIDIKGVGSIQLKEGSFIAGGAEFSQGNGGSVSITDIGSIYLQNESIISSEVISNKGNAGSIFISNVDSIVLEEDSLEYDQRWSNFDSFISSETYFSKGNAGTVSIVNVGSILLKGYSYIDSSTTSSEGYAGSVELYQIGELKLDDNSSIATSVEQSYLVESNVANDVKKGNITINGARSIILNGGKISTETNTDIPGGDIKILNTGTVLLKNGSEITAQSSGSGYFTVLIELVLNISHTHNSDVVAYLMNPDGDFITLFSEVGDDGDNFTNTLLSDKASVFISLGSAPFTGEFCPEEWLGALTEGELNGNWTLTLEDYVEEDNGSLNNWSITFNGNQTFTNSIYQDFGLDNSLSPSIDSVIETSDVHPIFVNISGVAGTIDINATDSLRLIGNSSIATSALDGNGGNVEITTGSTVILEDSRITTSAQSADEMISEDKGNGGSIRIETVDRFEMVNSELSADAFNNGGNIDIDPFLILINQSEMNASAINGTGGNITLVADVFLPSAESIFDASSEFGVSGSVDVQAPDTDLIGSLVVLPESLLDADSQLPERCAVKLDGNYSSMIVVGRGGVPVAPGDLLPAYPISSGNWGNENGAESMGETTNTH